MQAISTKFCGPTNSRGSRVIAKAEAGRIVHPWDHRQGIEDNHKAAAEALARKMGWDGEWIGGGSPNGCGWVFVNVTHSYGNAFSVEARA
ncbi:hypothetical protein [Castellaniella sp.]|uniref:hypothetical protein n=1 Tax=Castellaniella sp. TaxID=1955812 RepID=UPI002AFE4187|nr:hypothetical protein [Castellaniella sp.]